MLISVKINIQNKFSQTTKTNLVIEEIYAVYIVNENNSDKI